MDTGNLHPVLSCVQTTLVIEAANTAPTFDNSFSDIVLQSIDGMYVIDLGASDAEGDATTVNVLCDPSCGGMGVLAGDEFLISP